MISKQNILIGILKIKIKIHIKERADLSVTYVDDIVMELIFAMARLMRTFNVIGETHLVLLEGSEQPSRKWHTDTFNYLDHYVYFMLI